MIMNVDIKQIFQELEDIQKVSPYSIYELREMLENDSVDYDEMERLCFLIVTNLFDDKPLLELQNNSKQILWYDYLKLHIYLFLKGKKEYSENRSLLAAGSSIITENLVSELFVNFGVDDKLIPLVVSLLLCIATKVSTEAWCSYFYDNTIKNNELLLNKLKEMIDTNDSGKV